MTNTKPVERNLETIITDYNRLSEDTAVTVNDVLDAVTFIKEIDAVSILCKNEVTRLLFEIEDLQVATFLVWLDSRDYFRYIFKEVDDACRELDTSLKTA